MLRFPRRLAPAALILLAAVALPTSVVTQGDESPRAVVRRAERSVHGDSADVVGARWRAALGRDSSDRAAMLGLATIAREAYDFEAAEDLFNRLLATTGGRRDPWALQARYGLYRTANAAGNARRADSLLRLVITDARAARDTAMEIAALIGFTNVRSSNDDALFRTLDSVAALLPPGDNADRAEYLCRLGLYRGVGGDAAGSTLIARGFEMAERVGERRLAGHCLEAAGLLQSLRQQDDSALATYDRAAERLRATNEHAGLARIESRRSDILQSHGRLGEARAALERVLVGARISRNGQRLANGYNGLGMLALLVGDLPAADEWFGKGAALHDSLGLAEGAMISRQNSAWVLATAGDLEAARAALEASLAEAIAGGFVEDVFVVQQRLARVAMRAGDWATAERRLAEADSVVRAHGLDDVRAGLAYDRGRLALGRGNPVAAARLFEMMLSETAPDEGLVRYTVRARLAEAWAVQGLLDRAEQELTGATDELERWRATLDADELRRWAFAATALGEHDPQAPVARVIAALASAGRAEQAFALAERRRARTLQERLVQAEALRETDEGAASDVATRAQRAVSAAEIAAAIPDSATAVLEFVAGSEGAPSTLFVVTRDGVQARLLPSADSLAQPIERFLALLEAGEPAEALAARLGTDVLGPATDAVPARVTRLVIVPDGPLHRLAFDALRLPDGGLAVERWAVGLAPSAAIATLLRPRAKAPASAPRLLALGDPAFPGERAAGIEVAMRQSEIYRNAFAASGGLPRLDGSGDEVRAVARYAAESEVRLRGDASEAWLKAAPLDRFDVIHLATHALVDDRSLARTALALAPGGEEDGFLSPADLAALRLDADLVVLSACRTAGGVVTTGEGVQGLTTPMLEAGARAVVATQWRIGDRGTVRLVRDFYDALAHGAPVADALREAKLAALRRGAPASEWAGFTVVGDPLVRLALHAPATRPSVAWVAGGIGALALAASALVVLRRRRA